MTKWWLRFGKIVAQNWQKNDNDLAEHLCYNPNMRNWDFARSPSFNERVYTVEEISKLARISRIGAYELIKKEYFPVIRVGSLIRIPTEPFNAWLDGRGN